MEATFRIKTFSNVEQFIRNLPLDNYGIIEFSYGGFNIDYFIKYLFNPEKEMQPTRLFHHIFNKKNLITKKFVGVSAGAIMLGLILLDLLSEFQIHQDIVYIIKWFQTNVNKTPSIFHYYSLGVKQKEVLSVIQKSIPKNYLNLTILDITNKLGMGYYPEFIYFELPNKIVPCPVETTIFDAIFKSSDVFGIKDGGFSQQIPGYQPLYTHPKALVFAISNDYQSICVDFDTILFR